MGVDQENCFPRGRPASAAGVGAELWKSDVSFYESADTIAAALARAGKPADDDSVLYRATSSLLRDVIDAAGGVEQSHVRLRGAIACAQDKYDRWSEDFNVPPDSTVGLNDDATEDAWYALEELMIWGRTLDERLRRQSLDRARYPAGQGLIPALAEGARRDAVVNARSRLLAAGLKEARLLAGLNLHMQSLEGGSKGARVRSGRVVLPFPDLVSARVGHRSQLTFNDNRDGLSFADKLMAAVEQFMEDLIYALAAHIPERFKATGTAST